MMTTLEETTVDETTWSDRRGLGARDWLWLLAVLLVMVAVHLPSLELGFVGDDFEWWLETRYRMIEPSRFLEPFGGLRLTNPPMLAADQLIWGSWTPGWHVTTLAIQGLAVVLLFMVAVRVRLGRPGSAAVAALWATSPYTAFMAREVHVRHDPLLLACWLGLGLVWPGENDRWTIRRVLMAVVLALVSALTKESWVVLPGFAAAYELAFRGRNLWSAVRTAALWSIGPLVFVAAYVLRPAVESSYALGYYSGGLRAAAKIPSTLAAFCGLAELDTSSLRFGPAEWTTVALLVAVAVVALRTRSAALLVGGALYVLPLVPLIPVPVMGVHYAYAPYAGFLLMGGGLAKLALDCTAGHRARLLSVAVICSLVIVVFLSGIAGMAGETADARRRAEANERLVAEAEAFLPQLPGDRALVCVRLEDELVSAELATQVEGLPKTYFNRGSYPYGLAGWAELFSWVGQDRGGPLWREIPAGQVGDDRYGVIGHVQGRFVTLPVEHGTALAAAEEWSKKGRPVRVIEPVPTR